MVIGSPCAEVDGLELDIAVCIARLGGERQILIACLVCVDLLSTPECDLIEWIYGPQVISTSASGNVAGDSGGLMHEEEFEDASGEEEEAKTFSSRILSFFSFAPHTNGGLLQKYPSPGGERDEEDLGT